MNARLQEVVTSCERLNILEKRNMAENSCSFVFATHDRESVNNLFESIFGPPAKPTEKGPDICQILLTSRYGGIRPHQKLYMKRYEGEKITVLAMFRTWRYGKYFTVKLAVVHDAELEPGKRTWWSVLLGRITNAFCKF